MEKKIKSRNEILLREELEANVEQIQALTNRQKIIRGLLREIHINELIEDALAYNSDISLILEKSIRDVGISVRTTNALCHYFKRNEVDFPQVKTLILLSKNKLTTLVAVGPRGADDVEEALAFYGVRLASYKKEKKS